MLMLLWLLRVGVVRAVVGAVSGCSWSVVDDWSGVGWCEGGWMWLSVVEVVLERGSRGAVG